jgi:predicted Rossmann fold nucleotide-binding protein DprA/Smf involved in DNA uptake
MMPRVAIVGSRPPTHSEHWPLTYRKLIADVEAYVDSLGLETVVVSGGARGVDRAAICRAKKRGLVVVEVPAHPALWDRLGKAAGHLRSRVIVDLSRREVAFTYGETPGTMSTIKYAHSELKPVELRCYSKEEA